MLSLAVRPLGLDPDPDFPGGCVAFFVDWQYASTAGDEPADPVRSQYHEFVLLVNAVREGQPVHTCTFHVKDLELIADLT